MDTHNTTASDDSRTSSSKDAEIKENDGDEKAQESKELELLNKLKHALADYANLQKENERERSSWIKFASQRLIEDLLPILEHYEQAMACVPKEMKKEQWVAGFFHIQKQFEEFMRKNGIEKIKAEGEKFNTERHESIGSEESDQDADVVLKQVRPGYILHGKVLRPAQVIVSTERNLKNVSP